MKKKLFPARGLNRDRCIPLCRAYYVFALASWQYATSVTRQRARMFWEMSFRRVGRLLQMEHLVASLIKSLLQGGHDSLIRVLPADLLSLFLKLFLIFVHLCNDSGTLSLSSRYISTVCLDRILHLQVFAFSSSWLITKVLECWPWS